ASAWPARKRLKPKRRSSLACNPSTGGALVMGEFALCCGCRPAPARASLPVHFLCPTPTLDSTRASPRRKSAPDRFTKGCRPAPDNRVDAAGRTCYLAARDRFRGAVAVPRWLSAPDGDGPSTSPLYRSRRRSMSARRTWWCGPLLLGAAIVALAQPA